MINSGNVIGDSLQGIIFSGGLSTGDSCINNSDTAGGYCGTYQGSTFQSTVLCSSWQSVNFTSMGQSGIVSSTTYALGNAATLFYSCAAPPTYTVLGSSNVIYWVPTATRLEEAKSIRFSIDQFATLNANWDGYGASPIAEPARENARHFVDMIEATPFGLPAPDVSPTPAGTISFEWEAPHAEAYLEIGNTRYSGFIKFDQEQQPFLLQGHADSMDQQIVTLIQTAIAGPPTTSAPTITEMQTQWHERLAA
ncbi:MAG TPA: hypothetical protein VMF05_12680 [Stellaceae bacterium]|nr:hypothetical protein [Stellaceae bacterium]